MALCNSLVLLEPLRDHWSNPGTVARQRSAVKGDADNSTQVAFLAPFLRVSGDVDFTLRAAVAAQARCCVILRHRHSECRTASTFAAVRKPSESNIRIMSSRTLSSKRA